MTLPKRPPLTDPIPNEKIASAPEQYVVKAPYWDAVLEGDLTVDSDGKLVLTGGYGDGDPNATVKGAYGSMPLGPGLTFEGEQLQIAQPAYTYCTPAYPELPPTEPPYGCNTEVNTTGVTDFTDAWKNCSEITEFPCVDSSSVTDFSYAWAFCQGLSSFPNINTGSGENFTASWFYSGLTTFPMLNTGNGLDFSYTWCGCSMTEFPALDLSKGEIFLETWYYCESLTSFPILDVSSGWDFESTWYGCSSLTSFPVLDVSSGIEFQSTWGDCTSLTTFPLLDFSSGTNFNAAWVNCTSLTTFPAGMFDSCLADNFNGAWYNCALSQQSVDNILVSLDTAGQSDGYVDINGGTSSAPGPAGLAAKASLQGKGWTVATN